MATVTPPRPEGDAPATGATSTDDAQRLEADVRRLLAQRAPFDGPGPWDHLGAPSMHRTPAPRRVAFREPHALFDDADFDASAPAEALPLPLGLAVLCVVAQGDAPRLRGAFGAVCAFAALPPPPEDRCAALYAAAVALQKKRRETAAAVAAAAAAAEAAECVFAPAITAHAKATQGKGGIANFFAAALEWKKGKDARLRKKVEKEEADRAADEASEKWKMGPRSRRIAEAVARRRRARSAEAGGNGGRNGDDDGGARTTRRGRSTATSGTTPGGDGGRQPRARTPTRTEQRLAAMLKAAAPSFTPVTETAAVRLEALFTAGGGGGGSDRSRSDGRGGSVGDGDAEDANDASGAAPGGGGSRGRERGPRSAPKRRPRARSAGDQPFEMSDDGRGGGTDSDSDNGDDSGFAARLRGARGASVASLQRRMAEDIAGRRIRAAERAKQHHRNQTARLYDKVTGQPLFDPNAMPTVVTKDGRRIPADDLPTPERAALTKALQKRGAVFAVEVAERRRGDEARTMEQTIAAMESRDQRALQRQEKGARKAKAEETAECRFRPALDPRSAALVAAKSGRPRVEDRTTALSRIRSHVREVEAKNGVAANGGSTRRSDRGEGPRSRSVATSPESQLGPRAAFPQARSGSGSGGSRRAKAVTESAAVEMWERQRQQNEERERRLARSRAAAAEAALRECCFRPQLCPSSVRAVEESERGRSRFGLRSGSGPVDTALELFPPQQHPQHHQPNQQQSRPQSQQQQREPDTARAWSPTQHAEAAAAGCRLGVLSPPPLPQYHQQRRPPPVTSGAMRRRQPSPPEAFSPSPPYPAASDPRALPHEPSPMPLPQHGALHQSGPFGVQHPSGPPYNAGGPFRWGADASGGKAADGFRSGSALATGPLFDYPSRPMHRADRAAAAAAASAPRNAAGETPPSPPLEELDEVQRLRQLLDKWENFALQCRP